MNDTPSESGIEIIDGVNMRLKSLDFAGQSLARAEKESRQAMDRFLAGTQRLSEAKFREAQQLDALEEDSDTADRRLAAARGRLAWEESQAPGFCK